MYGINLAAVAKSSYPPSIRGAAEYLSLYEYLDVGTFLEHLSPEDLVDLNARCARITVGSDSEEDLDCLVLLSAMLCQAEGNDLEDHPEAARVSNLMILISFEDLFRKGVIEFYRDKATLGTENLDQTIAKLK